MKQPLKVLLISSTWHGMSGADRDWVTLANALGPEHLNITWVGVDGTQILSPHCNPQVVTRLIDLNFPLFTYLIHTNANEKRSVWLWAKIIVDQVLRLRQPLRNLLQLMKDEQFDIVVTNTSVVGLGLSFARRKRLPHLWFVKDCFDLNIPACRTLTRWMVRTNSTIVVPSKASAASFPTPVQVLPDGNNVADIQSSAGRFTRTDIIQRLGLPIDLPVVAQIGALCWWKGQHITAEAFVKLSKRGGPPLFSLLFLGTPMQDHKSKLQSILEEASEEWQKNIRFVQFDPDDFSYSAAADIVVHPSVLPDPLPNAVREAMILGKPVIASRSGGLPEMIEEGETGLLFTPGDSGELADRILYLVHDPAQRALLGEAAQQFATSHFDIDVRKQAFGELLSRIALPNAGNSSFH